MTEHLGTYDYEYIFGWKLKWGIREKWNSQRFSWPLWWLILAFSILKEWIYNINLHRRFITQSACEKLVHALVSSRLDYANAILAGLPNNRLKHLQNIQNIAARLVTSTPKYDHISPVLRRLHWLPISARVEFKVICLTFRIINGLAPAYMRDLVCLKQTTRTLRSANKMLLDIPKTRTKMYGDRAFSVIAPRLWNELSQSLREENNFSKFKKSLKTYLFKRAYGI